MKSQYDWRDLARFGLLEKVLGAEIIEKAVKEIPPLEKNLSANLRKNLIEKLQIKNNIDDWMECRGLEESDVNFIAEKSYVWETWCKKVFGSKIKSTFLEKKGSLDRVEYSLIRVKSINLANEIFLRIHEDESSFGEMATEFSLGPEKRTGGRIGPISLNAPDPEISELLRISEVGELQPPTIVGDWVVILRLESLIKAELDEKIFKKLLIIEGDNFIKSSVKKIIQSGIK